MFGDKLSKSSCVQHNNHSPSSQKGDTIPLPSRRDAFPFLPEREHLPPSFQKRCLPLPPGKGSPSPSFQKRRLPLPPGKRSPFPYLPTCPFPSGCHYLKEIIKGIADASTSQFLNSICFVNRSAEQPPLSPQTKERERYRDQPNFPAQTANL